MARFKMILCSAGVVVTAVAWAENGPTARAISNADWGTANDIFPYVARLEIDRSNNDFNGDGDRFNDPGSNIAANGDTFCTATLIAPDVMVTASHCFAGMGLAAGGNIPAGRVRANFGNYGQLLNAGGRIHPMATFGVAPNDLAYITLNGVPNPAAISPVPIMPRAPKVGDVNFAIGFGIGDRSSRGLGPVVGAPDFNIAQHNGGGPGRGAGAKGWSTITVDDWDESFVIQRQAAGEDFTEGGDSGGPGTQHHSFPTRAFASNIAGSSRNDFVMSAVSGGDTPAVNAADNGFNYVADTNLCGPVGGPNPCDKWTRLDNQGRFLDEAIRLGQVSIKHNLPNDPRSVPANTPVKVLVKARVTPDEPYTMNIRLWEEDNQSGGPYNFYGDMALAPTNFADDLAGIGFSAGVAGAAVREVCAWQELTAGDLIRYDEALSPLDPDLDWTFQINYGAGNTYVGLTPTGLDELNAGINACSTSIAAGTAIRGGFAMVPEPASVALLALGGMCVLIRKRG
ncbi:MAG: trypsin-like serine protease [Phycisphaerae bacterium]